MWTGKWTVNSRRGSRRTRRMPGSRSRRSAARSNCCCATSQALIGAATCSVVMERRTSVSGGRRDRRVGVGRLPDDPTGRVDRSLTVAGLATRDSCATRSIAAGPGSRLPDGTGRQGCRNRAATSVPAVGACRCRPVQDRGADAARAEVRPDRRPDELDRDRRPGRASGTRARTSSRKASTSGADRVQDRRAARSVAR